MSPFYRHQCALPSKASHLLVESLGHRCCAMRCLGSPTGWYWKQYVSQLRIVGALTFGSREGMGQLDNERLGNTSQDNCYTNILAQCCRLPAYFPPRSRGQVSSNPDTWIQIMQSCISTALCSQHGTHVADILVRILFIGWKYCFDSMN